MKTIILENKESQYYIEKVEDLLAKVDLQDEYEILPEYVEFHFADPMLIMGGVQAIAAGIVIIDYGYKAFKTLLKTNEKRNGLDKIRNIKKSNESPNNYVVDVDGNNIEISLQNSESAVKISIQNFYK
ncbi:hypothetical protein KPL47_07925 [Clostridium estertheticum]|uniref:hypothetical protein n=1 Tax=Clostridium estertheticum TaxID=238834 RepID=UPI001C0D4CBF|nr:hypothetical protein [Clostridium estertheticum]MBU3176297.1 hypothetical protein [Clostridium estertheticum]